MRRTRSEARWTGTCTSIFLPSDSWFLLGLFFCCCASTSIRHDTVDVRGMCAYNREEEDDEENRVGKKKDLCFTHFIWISGFTKR